MINPPLCKTVGFSGVSSHFCSKTFTELTVNSKNLQDFFDSMNMPSLSLEVRQTLEALVTKEESLQAPMGSL